MADKCIMPLSVPVMHYSCSAAIIAVMLWLARRNRRSGWRRVRADTETLRQWHLGWAIRTAFRPGGDYPAPGPEDMGRQLAAFQEALEAQRGPVVHVEPSHSTVAAASLAPLP